MSTKENAKVNPGQVQFRWRSLLGVSVGLFLLFGILLNIVPALLVPLLLHLNGPAGAGWLVVSNQADATLIGRSLADIGKHEPRLGAFFVSFMDTMCAYMLSFGIVYVTIAWFALRRGHWWAFWTLVVSSLVVLPYYALIAVTYASFGVSLNDLSSLFTPRLLHKNMLYFSQGNTR
ncbi:MAG: hypothetical protein ABI396_09485 [Ktedonobacteraceae bacterium]